LAQIEDIPVAEIAYVDETGIDTFLAREHGWSLRGTPVIGTVSGRKYRRTGIVAAKMGESIIEPLQYSGTMDSTLFEAWFETRLLAKLPPNTTVVMDNASFHRKKKLYPLSEKAGVRLVFLPPYSPNLNPIEHFWAWLKRHLRKILPFYSAFDEALYSAFQVD
jgi:transposase